MLGLSGYGSSDDSDQESRPETKISTSSSLKSQSSATINSTIQEKGKKKLDISFLPKDIQDALTKGISDNDSDDEDELQTIKLKSKSISKSNTNVNISLNDDNKPSRSSLLDILPKVQSSILSNSNSNSKMQIPSPVESKQSENKPVTGIYLSSTENSIVDERDKKRVIEAKVDHSSQRKLNQTKYWEEDQDEDDEEDEDNDKVRDGGSSNDNADNSKDEEERDNDDDDDNDDNSSNVNHNNNNYRPYKAYSSILSTSVDPRGVTLQTSVSSVTSKPFDQLFDSSSFQSTSYQTSYVGPASLPPPPILTSSSLSLSSSDGIEYDNKTGNKRKRDRDLEQQLLRGNTDIIDILDAKVIQANYEWNSESYASQMQREQEVRAAYNLSNKPPGKDASGIIQPTKMQNRKHQINSLAFSAAEMELKMLDAKSNRMRNQTETKGKYGW